MMVILGVLGFDDGLRLHASGLIGSIVGAVVGLVMLVVFDRVRQWNA